MSLSEELAELERQRRHEVRMLHYGYLRTKRDVQRAVSPSRIVRQHMGISLTIAAVIGLILAPGTSRRAAPESHGQGRRPRQGGVSVGWMKKVIGKFFPHGAAFIPDDAAKPETPGQEQNAEATEPGVEKRGIAERLLELLASVLLSNINWRSLINQMLHGMHQKTSQNGKKVNQHGDKPQVSVADAGTVKPHDYESFQ
jgi:hypothetical protein